MKVDERRAKIREMIAREAEAVQSEDMAGYMDTVISAVAILKQIASTGKWDEMPQERIVDMIDAAGSTLIFSRELLIEVQRMVGKGR